MDYVALEEPRSTTARFARQPLRKAAGVLATGLTFLGVTHFLRGPPAQASQQGVILFAPSSVSFNDTASFIIKDFQSILLASPVLTSPSSRMSAKQTDTSIFSVHTTPETLFRCQENLEGTSHRLAWAVFVQHTQQIGTLPALNHEGHYGLYAEHNPVRLPRSLALCLQPCNAASSLAYYDLVLATCQGRLTASRHTLRAASLLAYGSATMHATETGYGASVDTTAIRLLFDVQTLQLLHSLHNLHSNHENGRDKQTGRQQERAHAYVAGAHNFTDCLYNKVAYNAIHWTNPYRTTDAERSHSDRVDFVGCDDSTSFHSLEMAAVMYTDTILWIVGGSRALTGPLGNSFITLETEQKELAVWRTWLSSRPSLSRSSDSISLAEQAGVTAQVHTILLHFINSLLYQEKVIKFPLLPKRNDSCQKQRHTTWHLLSANVLKEVAALTAQVEQIMR
eukprot:gb/GEZN01006269.1/.p1 GENE.gb/GEZN01006269.1/~~gb/GEZN01006269.1/.p1  ORF type:complete len:452 (+),score=58.41 gb/GEZN01006269.1/:191-1546(+)